MFGKQSWAALRMFYLRPCTQALPLLRGARCRPWPATPADRGIGVRLGISLLRTCFVPQPAKRMLPSMPTESIRVWDLPTRLFHWLLVAAVIGSVVTAQLGGNAMVWHFRCGFTIATLLLFRLIWGFVGGRWSRFSAFVYSPATFMRYLRGQGRPEHALGHNPLGAASVFAMLAVLIAQVSTGVFSDDEIAAVGPFAKFVSNATVSLATSYHKGYGKTLLIVLGVLHLAAILFYFLSRRENLVKPMISGDKAQAGKLPPSRDDAVSRLAAAMVFAACASLVAWGVSLSG